MLLDIFRCFHIFSDIPDISRYSRYFQIFSYIIRYYQTCHWLPGMSRYLQTLGGRAEAEPMLRLCPASARLASARLARFGHGRLGLAQVGWRHGMAGVRAKAAGPQPATEPTRAGSSCWRHPYDNLQLMQLSLLLVASIWTCTLLAVRHKSRYNIVQYTCVLLRSKAQLEVCRTILACHVSLQYDRE